MGRRKTKPVILAFGGYDPTAGAGVLMDARAVTSAGGYPVAVPSCLALQSTTAFDRVVPLSRETIERALACVGKAHRIAAVKIGMVGTRAAALSILSFLEAHDDLPLVLDPVIRASSGGSLLSRDALPAFRKLFARADVITPNLPEIEKLLDRTVRRFEDAVVAARDLADRTGADIVLKGGHFPWRGKAGVDLVFEEGTATLLAPGRKLPGRDAHGTGCAFASALATRIALGQSLPDAARFAKTLVEDFIAGGFPSAEGRWTLDDGRRGEE